VFLGPKKTVQDANIVMLEPPEDATWPDKINVMKVVATEVSHPASWNALVVSLKHHSALQGWGWGEVKRLSGWVPTRLKLERDGIPIAAAQILRRNQGPVAYLYAPRGPALNDLCDLEEIALALRAWAGPGDVSLKIEPPTPIPSDGDTSVIPRAHGPWSYVESTQPEHTVLLNLTLGADKLLANMHQMARRNTRQSLKVGVTAGPDDDFQAFWDIFTETNTRSRLKNFTRAYYEAVLRECNQHGGDAAIITARLDGVPLATGMVIGLGSELDYLYGGSTKHVERTEGERDPKGPNGFYWGMIRYGLERGYKHLDLFGIPRQLSEEKHSFGVYQFKERLGGQKVWYPAYELPLSPLSSLVNTALRLRKNIMNYRARGTTKDVL
jgi:lipid II:glycine glycyltransferase (peptidoglycan interpeptide bridge formation enzyme)